MTIRDDETQILTYIFGGTVTALQRTTLVSEEISFSFRTKHVRAYFPTGTQRLNQISVLIAQDGDAPANATTTGQNIFQQRGNITYISGENETVELTHEIHVDQGRNFIKVHANNTDGVNHTIDVIVTIARLKTEE